jgi:hypothetical protein
MPVVIAGLDPAIHLLRNMLCVPRKMDKRVEPARDGFWLSRPDAPSLLEM